eukprot:2189166-Amphidinium_carterae.1
MQASASSLGSCTLNRGMTRGIVCVGLRYGAVMLTINLGILGDFSCSADERPERSGYMQYAKLSSHREPPGLIQIKSCKDTRQHVLHPVSTSVASDRNSPASFGLQDQRF